MTEKRRPDGTSVTYAYDGLGRLLAATDRNGTLAFTYDALGRVLTATSHDGRTLTYSYDPGGNRVGLQDETGNLTVYGYDARNLLISLTDPRTGAYGFGYDALGRRTRLTRPNGTITTYGYDAASRVVGLTHSGRRSPFETLSYSYDPSGNRITDTRNETRHQYAYDPLDQLTQVQMQENRARWKVKEAYAYDAVGNRLTGPDGRGYQYDAANHLTQDRTHSYAYDANGNLIEKVRLRDGRVTTYTYDPENRLIRVVAPRTEVTFQYDPLGRRTEKRVIRWEDEDGDHEPDPEEERPPRVTRYLYDHQDILATSNDSGREAARYAHGPGIDEPLAEVRGHRARFYHADGLGSVIALTGRHGDSLRRYRYSAFGIPEDHRGDAQPFRFTGREWDKEIDLYYYRARYYHPWVGGFLQEDPLGLPDGLSAYAYVRNAPTRAIDPSGLAMQGPSIEGIRQGNQAIREWLSILPNFILDSFFPVDNQGIANQLALNLLICPVAKVGGSAGAVPEKLYRYVFRGEVDTILKEGLAPGYGGKVYTTPTGSLSPLQAQIDLALPPNRGLRDAVIEIDVQVLRKMGFEVPPATQVGRWFNMPGGGAEVIFNRQIPPEAIRLMP
jgi:RHS repeat-associated protein